MSLHEQARAEAEKKFPDTNPLALALAMRDVFQQGFLAGHEAATRTRVVTTEDIERVLADHTWGGVDTMGRVTCHDSTGGWHVYEGNAADHERHQAEALMSLLYDPEEDR